MEKVICIVGPTASGKTSLSVELAKEINGEIISADSMQIYKELSIGTAKVTEEEMQNIKHHLVDFVDINQEFSVAEYKKLCYEKIEEILSKGKVPIIVGGTGLYVSSVVKDMDFTEEKVDLEYRNKLYKLAETKGNEYLHNMLKNVDPSSANDIHMNNVKRVIRALEMANTSKSKTTRLKEQKNNILKYDFKIFCLKFDKEILDFRINTRVDIMIEKGLEEEARKVCFLEEGTLRQAIGYKEFDKYFSNEISMDDVIKEIKLRTRQYAKRQMTWFKKMENIEFLDASLNKDKLVSKIMEKIYEKNEVKK